MYRYKMIPLAPDLLVSKKTDKGAAAAEHLESLVNEMAAKGWDFRRVDTFTVHEAPGCSLFGSKEPIDISYYVVTFRQEVTQ